METYADQMAREWTRSERLLDEIDAIHSLRTSMSNLAACLRIGAALCAAYGLGKWSSMRDAATGEWFTWHPGCGRPARTI